MTYRIPIFDLNFDDAEEKAIINTLRSKWISIGPKVTDFENRFSSMIRTKYAVALTNCTTALHLAMKLLGIQKDDEVICPSLTFVATVNAIRYVDAHPVFCDIKNYDDLNINPEIIPSLITEKTKAIIVMHYGGFSCNMDKVMKIASDAKLKVIEDASHAPLSEYKNSFLGGIGDIGCFSFFSNKNISTGEGGMLVTNNKEIFEKANLLRSHGMTSLSYDRSRGHATSYDVVELGYNYRMDDIRATLGLVQLKKIHNDINKRAFIRKLYIDRLSEISEIVIPFKDYDETSSNYIFPIVLRNSDSAKREFVRVELQKRGIQTSVHYPAVHQFSIYNEYSNSLPVTEYVTDNEISLPMYSKLSNDDIDYINQSIKEIIK